MKTKLIFGSLIVCFAVILAATFASAIVDDFEVSINGVEVTSENVAVFAGETIPIRVTFEADDNLSDVRVKAWIAGYRHEVSTSTKRMNLLDGSLYTKVLSLTMPKDIDPSEDYSLIIRIETKTDHFEEEYNLVLQRGSYELEILSVDATSKAEAGETIPISVVLKNTGMERLEDLFVKASIPELGAMKTVYFEDLEIQDCTESENNNCDEQDSRERIVYLKVPSTATEGVYTLEVEASNDDSSDRVVRSIAIETGKKTDVVVVNPSRTIAKGDSVFYELIIVNPSDEIQIYSIAPKETRNLVVSAEEPIVTVAAGSSRVVRIKAEALSTADEGATTFVADVTSNGKVVKTVSLAANVEGQSSSITTASPAVILTIVLVIIFVVLLIVLIALLTRKPEKSEEFGESYY